MELSKGEFVVNADGTIDYCTKYGGMRTTVGPAGMRLGGYEDAEDFAKHLIGWGYTRLYPESIQFPSGRTYSTEGSAIKEVAPANQFRIGGIYRQRNGALVRLEGRANSDKAQAVRLEVATPGPWKNSGGARRLSDGRYIYQLANAEYECHLIPGELDESGNPIGENGLTEAETSASASVMGIVNKPEVKRAPLAYFTEKTRFDAFNDWEPVFSGFEDYACTEQSHPLQRMSEGTNPTHGSALLLKD